MHRCLLLSLELACPPTLSGAGAPIQTASSPIAAEPASIPTSSAMEARALAFYEALVPA
jgi:hypothetical protein